MYQYFNENPFCKVYKRGKKKGQKEVRGDCVIRAMMLYWNCSWQESARRLADRGIELGFPQTASETFKSFLKKSDISHFKFDLLDNCRKRYLTVEDFCIHNNKGTYILNCPHHVVFVKDGTYYDAWKSGNETVRSIYE